VEPDHVFDMGFAEDNAADSGFHRWTINGASCPDAKEVIEPILRLTRGRGYRLRMRNESGDIPPSTCTGIVSS
jgi:hypothetical protein